MGVRDELTAARAITDGISARVFGHSFVADLHAFLERLVAIPDCGPGEATEAVMQEIRHEADRMIEAIETRIESGGDRQASQHEMAAVIYRIRRAMENIEAWHRHFAG